MQLADKYRPNRWSDVVGQDKIVARLRALAARGGLAGRAYWLSGQSGTGKTTIARLIAAEVADEFFVTELDAGALTVADLRDLEREMAAYGWGEKNGRAYLVVVCGADADGAPDPTTLRAFEAAPDQGVTYARGVWHHGLTALAAPARFVVCMSFSGQDDDVFVPLARPVRLVAREAARG